ncbi:co-chaperone DjlA [Neiella marina]|uniref:Co-chaperone protein DjlA n=1 Tax=Neiella holothuriorum TaxID=2870530 RepID=A0ABS7EJB1_9GAMM|nr:co-chaperone DjlA [Neiella holothuriorum]MBW8192305.1 co-chaperone DjlA [Neiella holothuriorum]
MPFAGKLLGFIFGFMFGHIIGAVAGLWIGHMFDKGMAREFTQRGGFGGMFNQDRSSLTNHMLFLHCTYAVMGHIAKASGQVTQADIAIANSLMDRMGLEGERRREMQEAHREGRLAGFPLRQNLREFKEACFGRHDVMQVFLEIQLQAAFADGELHTREQRILYTIADELGFARASLDQLFSMWQAEHGFRQHAHGKHQPNAQQQLAQAYQILGMSQDADFAAVKKAYRKLMAQHHPDKLMAKGVPKEALELAKEKTQDIQAAYELIKKSVS